jgi:hypothetical protein
MRTEVDRATLCGGKKLLMVKIYIQKFESLLDAVKSGEIKKGWAFTHPQAHYFKASPCKL